MKPPAPPRFLVATCAVVCAVSAVMLLAGAWQIGVTTDEVYHVLRLQNFFDCGWYLLADDLAGCRPGDWVNDQYVYAPVATLAMHGINVLVGNEAAGTVSADLAAYQVRHVTVAVLGIVTAALTALVTRLLSGSWRWGVVAAAVLCALAPFTGNAMFNVKDVPVAAGYTALTAGLVLACRSDRGGWRPGGGVVLLVGSGLLMALGTRPGMWPALGASGLVHLLCVASWAGRRGSLRELRWRVGEVLGGVALAGAVLLAVYPSAFSEPLAWMVESASSSASYNENSGSRMYVPVQFLLYTPVVLAGLALVMLLRAWTRLPRARWNPDGTSTGVTLVALQCFLMPVLAILMGAYLYHGLRQLLFLYPALAVLLTLEVRRWQGSGAEEPRHGPGRRGLQRGHLVAAGLAVGLVVPLVAQLQLYPYAYAYASELADATGRETADDYWRASFAELAPRLPGDQFVLCTPALLEGRSLRFNREAGSMPTAGSADCRFDENALLPIYRDWGEGGGAATEVADTFVAAFPSYLPPGENCAVEEQVWRRRHWTRRVMGQAGTCRLELMAPPDGPITFGADLTDYAFLLGGWSQGPGREGVRVEADAASLGLAVEPADDPVAAPTVLELDVRGEIGGVRVNNRPVDVRQVRGSSLVRVTVPASQVMAADGRIVLTLLGHDQEETTLMGVEVR